MTEIKNHSELRYSPKPRSEYKRIFNGVAYGPATSQLFTSTEIWNLAYLSFDYDSKLNHIDPNFTTYIRRTTQMRLDGSGIGIGENSSTLVGSLLSFPAPRFVYVIKNNKMLLSTLPLYKEYGDTWLDAIAQRERVCEWDVI